MSEHYVLAEDGKTPIKIGDFMEWARQFETMNRRVGLDLIGDIRISTVFLGLDHNFMFDGPPVLWETMIFGGQFDGEQDRYTSYEDAVAGHAAMVQKVKDSQ